MAKKIITIITLIIVILGAHKAKPVRAFEITSDPQYVVINFADFYYYDWQAPEDKWQTEIKPTIRRELRRWKDMLTIGNPSRRLAWSTLLEYMNFPKDSPGPESAYVIQAKRIMEIAEDEDLPIFMPLNGVQWWDELPELWNYWDPDGNQTPGCTNNDYSACGFKKLRDPSYRRRFIAGYKPENKLNVDWKDWENPMGFSVRNWGGPDVLVAPSPNIISKEFEAVQKQRFNEILKEISINLSGWQERRKEYLFSGIAIGTEITLNAAVEPGDRNFKPFGYRAIQDVFCPAKNKFCGKTSNWNDDQLHEMRKSIIAYYLNGLSRIAASYGLPKERIYTHVWSEADPDDSKYTDAIGASFGYFSRPGLSLYGKAENPFDLLILKNAIEENGFLEWAAPEFSPLTKETANWQRALHNTLNNSIQPVKLIDIYNERDIVNTPAIAVLLTILQQENKKNYCYVSETIPLTINRAKNPDLIKWRKLEEEKGSAKQMILLWKNKAPLSNLDPEIEMEIDANINSIDLTSLKLDPGLYWWTIKRSGCEAKKWTTSTPRFFIIDHGLTKQDSLYIKISSILYRLLNKIK